MKGMIIYLCLVPLALLVLTQIVAFAGMPGEAIAHGLAVGEYIAPRIVYAVGGAGAIVCLLLAVMLRRFHNDDDVAGTARLGHPDGAGSSVAAVLTSGPVLVAVSVVTVIAVMAGPLLWGHAVGEFHLSHHLVRAVLLAGVFVLYWLYGVADR